MALTLIPVPAPSNTKIQEPAQDNQPVTSQNTFDCGGLIHVGGPNRSKTALGASFDHLV